jgi:heme A synthase
MKPARILANLVGMMLFVQVILGGGAVLLGWDVSYHLAWGLITFIVLIIATVFAVRTYGRSSNIFKVGIAAIIDYIIQIILGFVALNNSANFGYTVVTHLTNAFVLGVFTTYFISFADSAEKTGTVTVKRPMTTTQPMGT